MKATEIKGLEVRVEGASEPAGTVSDLEFDLDRRVVTGICTVQEGRAPTYVLRPDDVRSVSEGVLHLQQGAAPIPLSDSPADRAAPTFNSLEDMDVMTETGRPLGTLSDVKIDVGDWSITQYVVFEPYNEFNRNPMEVDAGLVSYGAQNLFVSESVALDWPRGPIASQ